MERFGEIASIEYRALGITTALSPQVDIATEPRWWRFDGTFCEDTDLATAMGEKPVVVVLRLDKPAVVGEFEPFADAILVSFGVQNQAVLDIVSGRSEPSGLLPMQLPADMETVETQKEDVPRDMIPYTDAQGNRYDFAFGMDWSGVIRDERVRRYGDL